MHHSFLQKFVSMVFAGLAAASLLWVMKHVVFRAMHENGAGWREMYQEEPADRHKSTQHR